MHRDRSTDDDSGCRHRQAEELWMDGYFSWQDISVRLRDYQLARPVCNVGSHPRWEMLAQVVEILGPFISCELFFLPSGSRLHGKRCLLLPNKG